LEEKIILENILLARQDNKTVEMDALVGAALRDILTTDIANLQELLQYMRKEIQCL
jgi:hypothetical protein